MAMQKIFRLHLTKFLNPMFVGFPQMRLCVTHLMKNLCHHWCQNYARRFLNGVIMDTQMLAIPVELC